MAGEGLQTRLFLPSWWVRSYEAALVYEQAATNPFFTGRVLPASNSFDVHVISLLVAYVQRRVLSQSTPVQGARGIHIDISALIKELGVAALNRKGLREDLLLGLGGLKILHQQPDASFAAYPLFQNERWQYGAASTELNVGLAPLGEELFCGYADGYADVTRLLTGSLRSRAILGEQPPLLLWRSLWLDLQGHEQALLLRLEVAMQWAYRCLQLDGVFGEDLTSLFQGLRLPGKDLGLGLAPKLRILQRLLRKLHEHGFLQSYGESSYLAFGEREAPLQLVWKVAPHRFLGSDHASYLARVASLFTARFVQEESYTSSLPLTAGLPESRRYELLRPVLACLARPECQDLLAGCHVIEGNLVVPLAILFLEWSLRQDKMHAFPLPEAVISLTRGKVLAEAGDSEGALADKLRRFVEQFAQLPELAAMLERQLGASVVAKISQGDDAFVRLKQSLREQAVVSSPPLSGREQGSEPSHHAASAPDSSKPVKPAMVSAGKQAAPVQAPSKSEPPAGARVGGEPVRKLVRSASQRATVVAELDKIKKAAPGRYQELTKAYLQSLDEASRRLILDIKQRMQPSIFDKHLQQRLTQFMLEHPNQCQADTPRLDQENISK